MYKTASLLFITCFAIYVLFSRQPDYFTSEFTPGESINSSLLPQKTLEAFNIKSGDYPVVKFAVGNQTFYINGSDNLLQKLFKPGKRVQVIYDENRPRKAAIYQWAGYWIVASELMVLLIAYLILFGIAIAITGKNESGLVDDSVQDRKTKYN